jgi:hypothetical protein
MFGPSKIMGSNKGKEFVNQLVTQLAMPVELNIKLPHHITLKLMVIQKNLVIR